MPQRQQKTQSAADILRQRTTASHSHGGGETVWLNPPYGREIGRWVKKAWEESQKPGTVVVLLLPARTDTAWFHEYCRHGDVVFVRGRLKFGGSRNSAPFPSMVVKFGGAIKTTEVSHNGHTEMARKGAEHQQGG